MTASNMPPHLETRDGRIQNREAINAWREQKGLTPWRRQGTPQWSTLLALLVIAAAIVGVAAVALGWWL